jgi:hypothetical protein
MALAPMAALATTAGCAEDAARGAYRPTFFTKDEWAFVMSACERHCKE